MRQGIVSKLLGLLALHTAEAAFQIVPGATWTATNTGRHIQAHGSGIITVGSTYYMMGEDKTDGSPFQNINCYSSEDLIHWKFENALLSRTASGDLGPNRVVERPKIIYNDQTRDYVMYMHIDNSTYAEAKVGVATSKSVCGDYAYRGSFRPLGYQSRDMGLFKDDDGTAYLLTEDRANGLRIDKLSSDYLQVVEPTYLWNESIEAPAVLKRDGYYFMFGSHLSGWAANDNVYSYATSMAGPWSSWATFADVGSNTYQSQTNYILPVGDWAIYMGDRWHSENLMRSTYVWLPLNITGTTVRMANHESWSVDLRSKTWKEGPKTTAMRGDAATLSNGAVVVNCNVCSDGKAAGYIGGPSDGTATFPAVTLKKSCGDIDATLVFTYMNRDSTQRESLVQVNGVGQTIAFVPTGDDATVGQSVAHYRLKGGQSNVIAVSGINGTYGADTDAVLLPYVA